MSQDKLRVAIVGLGFVWYEHHEHAVRKLVEEGEIEVVAIADTDKARLGRYKKETLKRFGEAEQGKELLFFADGKEMIETVGQDLDAAFLYLPPWAHGPVEMSCIEKGVPFFVEKPLSVDMDAPRRIANAVKESGLITSVGFIERYTPACEYIRFYLHDGGKVLRAGLVQNVNPVTTRWRWTSNPATGGSFFSENTLHQLDMLRYWGHEFDKVSAFKYERDVPLEGNVNPYAYAVQYQMKSGAVISVFDNRVLDKSDAYRRHFTLMCDGALIDIEKPGIWVPSRIIKNGQEMASWPEREHWYYYHKELKGFLAKLRGEYTEMAWVGGAGQIGDVRSPYPDALESWAAAVAALESAERGGEVVDVASFDDTEWVKALERSRRGG